MVGLQQPADPDRGPELPSPDEDQRGEHNMLASLRDLRRIRQEIAQLVVIDLARGLIETGGPLALFLGAVADGQFLKRVGSTIVGAAGGGGGAPTTSEYLVGVADAGLDAERVVTNTPTVTWDLGTASQAKANVPDATTTTKGAVELATSGESAAGVVVQGNDARMSDARAPTGAASGDLGGTYPSPTVTQARGLRETAGPTTLALGAVSDGQFLKRDGSSIVGASGGGGGAPTTAEYLVGVADAGLDAERVVTNTATITWDLGTAGQAKANVASVPAHEHAAGDIVSGVLNVARVGTGSGDSTTFLDGSGAFSSVPVPGVTVKRLNSQHDIASATGTEVTDLSTTLVAGTYVFTYYLFTQASNTTVGLALGINYTGTTTRLAAHMRYADTGTTATTGVADSATAGVAEEITGIFATITKSTTACNLGPLTNHDAANTDTLIIVEGVIVVSNGGDLELWHNSDTANTTSLMVGSSLVLHKIT